MSGSKAGCSSKLSERTVPRSFFGVTESSQHIANECRIAFWADSTSEVDRLAEIVVRAGARNVEGPEYYEGHGYYAIFFEDLSGNRLEICYRSEGAR